MTTFEFPNVKAPLTPAANNVSNLLVLWCQPWVNTIPTATKLQCIWLETLNDAYRHEIDFVAIMAPFYSKFLRHTLGFEGIPTPVLMTSCYREIACDMTEANLKRMHKISELSEGLQERIWSEL